MTKTTSPEGSSTPTREQIIDLVGDVDDATVMAILRTGASYLEVEEAARRASGEATAAVGPAPLSGPATAVYEILLTEPDFAPPANDR